ncbi:glutamate/tyrosine decarboxylase-like PLP-dependent enzyme [Actinoplanes campanulatus]|uniref:Glutamate/tyrosine decarboxylase-like PLP-dependent enzyme n=1 Tax=Actinoplanes campanulatus TaxID=113559 RepID=A0A7W5AN68_9ACTN|nr:hypothetical protein [Actinoplanes campanulatus]MBB3099377.1 glutamate/tyrosine decarboxylase-like PLP-dependent enzyme [Actinoplanes campanulatus]GGN40232.1 hypothetical protein GCM10010109_69090 [Actinoplanes campanulatus]GID42414.1 hypothetical protein Aca09nite_89200 [Actinoplanes campanulatus]
MSTRELRAVKTYEARVRRSGDWWFVEVPGVDMAYTQARKLADVEPMVRDMLSLLLDVPADSFAVTITPSGQVANVVAGVKAAKDAAAEAQRQADQQTRQAVARLRSMKLTVRDVAALLDVSPTWVSVLDRESAA